RVVPAGEHLLAVVEGPPGVRQAEPGVECAGSLEAGIDRSPEVPCRPLERVLLRIGPRQIRVEAQALPDLPLASGVTRRCPQVEQRRQDVRLAEAGIAPDFLVALLEVVLEPRLAGGEEHSRRGVHAYAPSDLRVSVLAHRRAGRAIGILVRMQPQVSIARRRGLQATLGEDGIVRTEDYRSICQRPDRASGGDGPRLARPVRRGAGRPVRPIGPGTLLAR